MHEEMWTGKCEKRKKFLTGGGCCCWRCACWRRLGPTVILAQLWFHTGLLWFTHSWLNQRQRNVVQLRIQVMYWNIESLVQATFGATMFLGVIGVWTLILFIFIHFYSRSPQICSGVEHHKLRWFNVQRQCILSLGDHEVFDLETFIQIFL